MTFGDIFQPQETNTGVQSHIGKPVILNMAASFKWELQWKVNGWQVFKCA